MDKAHCCGQNKTSLHLSENDQAEKTGEKSSQKEILPPMLWENISRQHNSLDRWNKKKSR
eukprot:scaffold327900_cov18-Prasinocladus_malaysianus.AAC.1